MKVFYYISIIIFVFFLLSCDDKHDKYVMRVPIKVQEDKTQKHQNKKQQDKLVKPVKIAKTKTKPKHVAMRPMSFADTVKITRPAVVNIYTQSIVKTNRFRVYHNQLIPEKRRSQSLGSGFLISADGYMLTNNHVIKNASAIEVRLFDERRFMAAVVATDPKTDIALIKLKTNEKLPFLKLSKSEALRVGDWVIAIGNPLGLTSTVTAGIISAEGRRTLSGNIMGFQDFIQTDASINPGNSGGPLIDLSGEVVGINTAINPEGQGLGFAIPSKMVLEILPRLKKGGKVRRSSLGVIASDVPATLRNAINLEKGGALIRKVQRNGPCHRAGLKPGDVILELGGKIIKSQQDLAWHAGNIGIGIITKIVFKRGSKVLERDVKMGLLG